MDEKMTPAEQIVYLIGNKITVVYMLLDKLEHEQASIDVSITVLLVKRELQIAATAAKELAGLTTPAQLEMLTTDPQMKIYAQGGK